MKIKLNCKEMIFILYILQLPCLKQIVQYNGTSREEGVTSWKDLIQLGSSESDIHLKTRLKDMAINNCALLVYTSGTTGNPKG